MSVELKVDWCNRKAAEYACKHWHYSKCMPVGKLVTVGIWENYKYIGCVIFGRGANPNMLKKYGLTQTEGCELTRIALNKHETTVTRIVSLSIKMLKKISPELKMIVSYADMKQGHYGKIYQAGNWIYSGLSEKSGGYSYLIKGKWVHKRTLGAKYGRRDSEYLDKLFPNAEKRRDSDKHRYLMPLDKTTRKKILLLSKPYPAPLV